MVKGSLIKRGKIWYCVWCQTGRQHWKSTGETNKSKASAIRSGIIAPINLGDNAKALRAAAAAAEVEMCHARAASLRISNIWHEFSSSVARPDAAPATLASYRAIVRRMADWFAVHQPRIKAAADLGPIEAEEYARWLLTRIGMSTFNRDIGVLRSVWKILARKHGFHENPWYAVSLRRTTSTSRRELTIAELDRLINAADGEMRTLIALGIYTGMRLGDCATLTWDECDLAAGMIRRHPMKTCRRSPKILQIPIHACLVALLQTHAKQHAKWVLPTTARAYPKGRLNHGLRKLFTRAGIEQRSQTLLPGRVRRSAVASFHSLRHTFVSLCAANPAIQSSWVQEIVGHSNPAMTRHYTHIGADSARRAIDALPTFGGNAVPPSRSPSSD